MKVRPIHWSVRFVSSMWPARPSSSDRNWAVGFLSAAEVRLLDRMNGPDQRHAIAVARRVESHLDRLPADRIPDGRHHEVIAAALLHDVGKNTSGLGTYGRVIATLCGLVARDMAEAWQSTSGLTRKVGLYLRYGELGAEQLELAGSAPWVIAWSAEHHLDEANWSLPIDVGRILRHADGG